MANYHVEQVKDWAAFKDRQKKYLSYSVNTRSNFIFRGQSSNLWHLEPTIDRLPDAAKWTDTQRADIRTMLIDEFRDACIGLRSSEEHPATEEEWEFLGRHHGLPTTILDWTQSPFVGAYFAFHERTISEYVSIWVLQLSYVQLDKISQITIDSNDGVRRFNLRAAEQRGISMRIHAKTPSVEDLLGSALIRLDVPASERKRALVELDEMLVNARTLFRDLDAAAKLATIRALEV